MFDESKAGTIRRRDPDNRMLVRRCWRLEFTVVEAANAGLLRVHRADSTEPDLMDINPPGGGRLH
jgi:hypothetical protein